MDKERETSKNNEDRKGKGPSRNPNLLIPITLASVTTVSLVEARWTAVPLRTEGRARGFRKPKQ